MQLKITSAKNNKTKNKNNKWDKNKNKSKNRIQGSGVRRIFTSQKK